MYGISILIAYVHKPPLNDCVDVSRWARSMGLNLLCFHTLESEPCADLESYSEGAKLDIFSVLFLVYKGIEDTTAAINVVHLKCTIFALK